MVTFSGCVFDGAGGKEQPLPKQLIRAIEDKEYNRAYALLRRMRREGVALEEGKRAEALADALTCTLKLFKTLYDPICFVPLRVSGCDAPQEYLSEWPVPVYNSCLSY